MISGTDSEFALVKLTFIYISICKKTVKFTVNFCVDINDTVCKINKLFKFPNDKTKYQKSIQGKKTEISKRKRKVLKTSFAND